MSYYFLYAPKKISSILAYSLILVMLIGVGFAFSSRRQTTLIRASAVSVPENILVSNITDSAAVVSFSTAQPVTAFVKYSQKGSLEMVRFDDRDLSERAKRTSHYFTLEQLSANSTYNITIAINGQDVALKTPLTVKTLAKVTAGSSFPPIFGKIYDKNVLPAEDVLITVSLKKTTLYAPFTALSKASGEWIMTFPIVMDAKLQQVALQEDDVLFMTFRKGKTVSRVTVYYKNSSPVKSIILGTNTDLTQGDAVLGAQSQVQPSQNGLIAFPAANSVISTQRPVFRGVSKPNSLIQLTLQPPGKTSLVMTNAYGEWKLSNSVPLLPGNYVLNAESKGTGQKQTTAFLIGKSGESVLGDATASATLTPTITLAPTATPVISVPSVSPEPTTPVPTEAVTYTPTPVPVYPTPTVTVQRLPSAGAANTLAIIAASGLSLLGLLLVLY